MAQGDDKFVDAVDMKLRDVVKMIRGKRDTKVQLKVIPVGKIEPVVYELTRKKVEMKSQEARRHRRTGARSRTVKLYRIGVIDLPCRSTPTADDQKKPPTRRTFARS